MTKPKSTGDERGNLAFVIRNPLFDIRYSPPVSCCYPKTYRKYKKTAILKFKRFSLTSLSRSVSEYLNGSKRGWRESFFFLLPSFLSQKNKSFYSPNVEQISMKIAFCCERTFFQEEEKK